MQITKRLRSAMNDDFYDAYMESSCTWLTYLSGAMLYDGGLFVTREGF